MPQPDRPPPGPPACNSRRRGPPPASHPGDYRFALAAMPGLLGPRIFEAAGAGIAAPGDEHGHRALRACGKGTTIVLVPPPPGGRPGHRPRHRRPHRRDVQIAARHADPRTTMRYDQARKNPDRHPSHILAACTAPGT